MEKRFKTGLCLGKFMPIHKGHQYLIDSAIEQCETVHVMVCSLDSEPIPGLTRYSWVFQLYKDNPNVIVHWCRDENPQYDWECETLDEFYSYWIKSVYSRIDSLDAVFTSEEYGNDFARYLSVEHVLVDLERTKYPVSGTKVRENAHIEWEFLSDVVRPYYCKKVVIMGPESTGKSTLTERLADHFNTNYTAEYGREYTDLIPASTMVLEDYENIAIGHRLKCFNALQESNKVLFVDTEAITTKVFAEMYLNQEIKSNILDNMIQSQEFDKYYLLDIDVPWVDDGTRDFPNEEDRKRHFNRLKDVLDENKIEYEIVSGNYDERFKYVVNDLKCVMK